MLVVLRVSVVMLKFHDQTNLKRQEFISFTHQHQIPSLKKVMAGTQGQNLRAGTEAEAMEEACLLACSRDLFSLYIYTT